MMASFAAVAQEELRLGGGVSHDTSAESTYGWELDYAQGIGEHSYWTLGWLNEGHQLNDHRDGFAAQLWARTDLFDPRFSLSVGIGPYLYFDTVRDQAHQFFAPYGNLHGLRPLYSAEAIWYVSDSWLAYLRANSIYHGGNVDTTMVLLGLGYRFDGRSVSGASAPFGVGSGNNELTLFYGQTDLNSFVSERSSAYALEYRYHVDRNLDWTLGWVNEGGNEIIRRNGITTQLWIVNPVFGGRLTLGAGGGAYIVVNQQDQTFVPMGGKLTAVGSDDDRVSEIISFMAAYRFDQDWFARFSFNRLVTRYDRDADVLVLGAGYRF
jgi:hypothetical protein